jgi:hypothetical protein
MVQQAQVVVLHGGLGELLLSVHHTSPKPHAGTLAGTLTKDVRPV